jgi:hypothetical protein
MLIIDFNNNPDGLDAIITMYIKDEIGGTAEIT